MGGGHLGGGDLCATAADNPAHGETHHAEKQCTDDAAHDRHRVRIAAEALVELAQLIMQHRVTRNRIGEIVQLVLAW